MKHMCVVLGSGFGDEGKGRIVDDLVKSYDCPERTLVVRFSGGHQVGHTVVTEDGKRHVFSNFGSGTLRGAPTFWSRFCTVHPPGICREYDYLKKIASKDIILFVDPMAMITTSFDIIYNKYLETNRGSGRHGSVGVGFGATIERHTCSPFKLFVHDLRHPGVLKHRLTAIATYYRERVAEEFWKELDVEQIIQHDLDYARDAQHIMIVSGAFERFVDAYDNIIFEGNQGILLDMDHGVAPHVTRSNTTSKNAFRLMRRRLGSLQERPTVMYASRCYLTRHGAGPLDGEGALTNRTDSPTETNQNNHFQGDFRSAPLNLDWLDYAIETDKIYHRNLPVRLLHVYTCLDQIEGPIQVMQEGKVTETNHLPISQHAHSALTHYVTASEVSGTGLFVAVSDTIDDIRKELSDKESVPG